jgi:hypothetical protein
MPYAAESVLVTAAREAKKIWPALAGLGTVGFAVVKLTSSATPEARACAPRKQRVPLARSARRCRGRCTLLRAAWPGRVCGAPF